MSADGERLVGLRSDDAGRTRSEPAELGRLPAPPAWSSVASAPDGAAVVQIRHGSKDPARFGIHLVRWSASGNVTVLPVTEVLGVNGEWRVGDDYGAIDAAPDGSIWMAWAHPGRDEAPSRIAVARATVS